MNEQSLGETNTRPELGGVRIVGFADDPSELPKVYNPGHPDADEDGNVTMPNVSLPIEMVNLMTASRRLRSESQSLANAASTTRTDVRHSSD